MHFQGISAVSPTDQDELRCQLLDLSHYRMARFMVQIDPGIKAYLAGPAPASVLTGLPTEISNARFNCP